MFLGYRHNNRLPASHKRRYFGKTALRFISRCRRRPSAYPACSMNKALVQAPFMASIFKSLPFSDSFNNAIYLSSKDIIACSRLSFGRPQQADTLSPLSFRAIVRYFCNFSEKLLRPRRNFSGKAAGAHMNRRTIFKTVGFGLSDMSNHKNFHNCNFKKAFPVSHAQGVSSTVLLAIPPRNRELLQVRTSA